MHIESDRLKIFISHSWIDSDQYCELVNILDSSDCPWKNLSISEQDALLIFNKGEEAYSQEFELQEKRLEILKEKRYEFQRSLEKKTNSYEQNFNQEVGGHKKEIKKLEKIVKLETENINKEIEKLEEMHRLEVEKRNIEIRKIDKSKMDISSSITYLEKCLDPVFLKRMIVECENRLNQMIDDGAGERFIEAEKNYLMSLKEMVKINVVIKKIADQKHVLSAILADQQSIKAKADKIYNNIISLKDSIKEQNKKLHNSIEKIESEIKIIRRPYEQKIDEIKQGSQDTLIKFEIEEVQCQDRIDKLRNDINSANVYNVFTHEEDIFPYGKADRETVRLNPTLALSLYNKIREADIFLVLGQAFRQYKLWMDFEFKTAFSNCKRIICIIPADRDSLPPELRHFCETAVHWNKRSIIESVFINR